MPRNVQFQALLASLRAELRDSQSVALGIDQTATLNQALVRTQQDLYDEYDWPFLRIKPLMALSAGQQYYTFPTFNGFALNLERIEKVDVWYSNVPVPVERGIGTAEYAQYNSNIGVKSDPVQRWDVVSTGVSTSTSALEQLEVWPIPASGGQQLQFKGIRALRQMVNPTDVCDLDDRLIYLFAAAEILGAEGAKDAERKQKLADTLFQKITGRLKANGGRSFILGGGKDGMSRQQTGTIIRIGSKSN